MATVWVARDRSAPPGQPRLVAVKAILHDLAHDQEFSKMFVDEGRIIQMIRHPNVVDVYEASEEQGIGYIAMEWVEGDSLHAVIAEAGKRRPIPPEMAVRIIADAAGGLHAAHELKDSDGKPMNVVHRDVSPHNILLGVDGAVKLVDFGVAKAVGRLSEVTSAGQLKGKFGYMSPEQAMAKKVDRRSDLFALGIVLFELTTGRRLFRGEHDAETLHMVVSGKIPKPTSIDPNYPEALEKIVLRSLERDLEKRFQTAEEFQKALDAYLKSERTVVPRAGIANLLKKVLGERIEQRRKAIRSVLKHLDGALTPQEVPFTPLSSDPASSTGVSAITSGTGSGISAVSSGTGSGVSGVASGVSHITASSPSSPSGLSAPHSNPYSSPVASLEPPYPHDPSHPSALSYVTAPRDGTGTNATVVVKRGGMLGLAVGVVGLAVALIAVLVLVYAPRRKTTVVNLQSSVTLPAPPAPPTDVARPEVTADGIPAVPVDSLGNARPKPAAPPGAFRPAKPKESATGTAPPRKNPYE